MVINTVYSLFKNNDDEELSKYGIKNRSQLLSMQLVKPIPEYLIKNGNLKFSGQWNILVFSDGEPLLVTRGVLSEDGEYILRNAGIEKVAKIIYSYEYKDLVFISKMPCKGLLL